MRKTRRADRGADLGKRAGLHAQDGEVVIQAPEVACVRMRDHVVGHEEVEALVPERRVQGAARAGTETRSRGQTRRVFLHDAVGLVAEDKGRVGSPAAAGPAAFAALRTCWAGLVALSEVRWRTCSGLGGQLAGSCDEIGWIAILP